MINCPFCNIEIPDDCCYCDMCGTQLKECPTCKKLGRLNRCGSCGAVLVLKGQAATATVAPAPGVVQPVQQQHQQVQPGSVQQPIQQPVQTRQVPPQQASQPQPVQQPIQPRQVPPQPVSQQHSQPVQPRPAQQPIQPPVQHQAPPQQNQQQVHHSTIIQSQPQPKAHNSTVIASNIKIYRFMERGTNRGFNVSGNILLGRGAENCSGIFDDEMLVSRNHMQVEVKPDGLYIYDVGSTNGTSLNGVRINANQYYKLNSGDTIQLANIALILQ